jgi:hypothetical protein
MNKNNVIAFKKTNKKVLIKAKKNSDLSYYFKEFLVLVLGILVATGVYDLTLWLVKYGR